MKPLRRRSWWKILLVIFLLLAIALGVLWWWHNRPIKPVQLSAEEKVVVEQKLEAVSGGTKTEFGSRPPGGEVIPEEPAPTYEKGKREFEITERELNGLLNEHTKLGDSVRFELLDGVVHARVSTELDADLPVVGGKTLKARARFFVETGAAGPVLVLDDLTVWGVSVPNDWLGGLKGRNLLGEVLGEGANVSGVESLVVERGRLVVKLKE